MSQIASNKAVAERHAAYIASTAKSLSMPVLSTTDTQSTITANKASQSAHDLAQRISTTLNGSLTSAASSIRSTAATFEDFDNSR